MSERGQVTHTWRAWFSQLYVSCRLHSCQTSQIDPCADGVKRLGTQCTRSHRKRTLNHVAYANKKSRRRLSHRILLVTMECSTFTTKTAPSLSTISTYSSTDPTDHSKRHPDPISRFVTVQTDKHMGLGLATGL